MSAERPTHDHEHTDSVMHAHAFNWYVTVKHSHEHAHTKPTADTDPHRPHRHTPEQYADLRRQAR